MPCCVTGVLMAHHDSPRCRFAADIPMPHTGTRVRALMKQIDAGETEIAAVHETIKGLRGI